MAPVDAEANEESVPAEEGACTEAGKAPVEGEANKEFVPVEEGAGIEVDQEDDAASDGVALDEASWADIRARLRLANPRMTRMLELFEQNYAVSSPSEAFINIRHFLGDYLVAEFDHASFCQDLGDSEAEPANRLISDLGVACSLMLRLAVTIAKAFHLEMEDWADINQACSDALRWVPTCYALQRSLPGAVDMARNWRFAPAPQEGGELNPWTSDAGKELFEKAHHLKWQQVELFLSQDKEVRSCFAGAFRVQRVTPVQDLSIVALGVLRVDEAPGGFPAKSISQDDTILWEVENALGSLVDPGVVIDADWCEMQNDLCFVSCFRSVAPPWCHEHWKGEEAAAAPDVPG